MNNIAIIVSAGNGTRAGIDIPKQYFKINNKMILEYSLEKFYHHEKISKIILVIGENHLTYIEDLKNKFEDIEIIVGGRERKDSVYNALLYIMKFNPNHVLIHDAARPFLSSNIIDEVLDGLTNYSAMIPVKSVKDTVKQIKDNEIISTIDRNSLRAASTPQGFIYIDLYNSYNKFKDINVTDEAMIMEKSGFKVGIIQDNPNNFKITDMNDINIAQKMLNEVYEYRVGIGYDIHAFLPETHQENFIMFGGIKVNYPRKLSTNSDGDVILHALVDAILGTISDNDIGYYFSPKDPIYQEYNSDYFVKFALNKLYESEAFIVNVDIIIIAEEPKIYLIREQIKENISLLLNIEKNRISIKGKTSEKLGFIGRGEAVAAHAIVNIKKKI